MQLSFEHSTCLFIECIAESCHLLALGDLEAFLHLLADALGTLPRGGIREFQRAAVRKSKASVDTGTLHIALIFTTRLASASWRNVDSLCTSAPCRSRNKEPSRA